MNKLNYYAHHYVHYEELNFKIVLLAALTLSCVNIVYEHWYFFAHQCLTLEQYMEQDKDMQLCF